MLLLCQLNVACLDMWQFTFFATFFVALDVFNFPLFIWICDILFKQICCFVYLNVVLLKHTAAFGSMWYALNTLPVQVHL